MRKLYVIISLTVASLATGCANIDHQASYELIKQREARQAAYCARSGYCASIDPNKLNQAERQILADNLARSIKVED